jgi:hypothetical protein
MSCPYFIVRSANHPKAKINEFIIKIGEDLPTLPVLQSYTINTVFRYVFCPRSLPLAIPDIGLSYSSCLLFDFTVLMIIFNPHEIKFRFPAEIYRINFFNVWFIFVVVLCLVMWCDVTQCRNGGGYLMGTEPDIYGRCLQILSLTQSYKRACGSSFKCKQAAPTYLPVTFNTVGILCFIHALERHKTIITLY